MPFDLANCGLVQKMSMLVLGVALLVSIAIGGFGDLMLRRGKRCNGVVHSAHYWRKPRGRPCRPRRRPVVGSTCCVKPLRLAPDSRPEKTMQRSSRNDVEYRARNPRGHHDHAGGPLLDHLVGAGQKRFRDDKAERLGVLTVDESGKSLAGDFRE
jgi:hypothetical protein